MKNGAWAWKILGAAVVILMLWALLEMVASARRLQQVKAALKEKGETLNWRDVVATLPKEGSNGEMDFLTAIDGISRLPRGLLTDRFTSHGHKVPITKSVYLPTEVTDHGSSPKRRWVTNIWDEAAPLVQLGFDNWMHARHAATNDLIDLNLNWSMGARLTLPHLSGARNLSEWISSAAMHDLHRGDRDAALEKIVTGFRLWEIYDEPCLISALVRIAGTHFLDRAVWEALQHDGWTDSELAKLQRAVDSVRFTTSVDRALKMERSITVGEWQRAHHDLSIIKMQWSAHSISGYEAIFLTDTPLWRTFVANPDLAWYLGNFQQEFEFYHEGVAARSLAVHSAHYSGRSVHPPKHYVFSRVFRIVIEKSAEKVFMAENHRELTVTAIALKRYFLKHDSYPEKLDNLRPEFLKDASVDWMDGKELRYERLRADEFRLWSVGKDGIDNGSDPAVPGATDDMTPERGRDWVWPQASEPAEIKLFIQDREAEMKKALKRP